MTAHSWKRLIALRLAAFLCVATAAVSSRASESAGDLMVTDNAQGHTGGRLAVALRSEPKTLNPIQALDETSREVIACLSADLIHINRGSQKSEPALAKSWKVSQDGREYTLQLRRGLRFSDGQPFDADDVIFSFQVYLDEKVDAPQRDLLVVAGKPVVVQKLDAYSVRFQLAQPYAATERIFDGVPILPRHLLQSAYLKNGLSDTWSISTPPSLLAGLGPFRLKEYVPGQRIALERNPYYWKQDRNGVRLPYVNEIDFLFVTSEDAQVIRFQSGETDILSRLSAENFVVLEKQQAAKGYRVQDLGPGLEYNFLFFNLNDVSAKEFPEIVRKQSWFQDVRFRQAVSAAIDREGIVRLAYSGHATPLWGNVTPGNKLWNDPQLPRPPKSLERSRALLKSADFSWNQDGSLRDPHGSLVEFSILTSSSSAQRTKMATIVQDDLAQLGMKVHVVPLEFGTVVSRLTKSHDYEACVMGLVSGDADPTPDMNVWLSSGETHLWHPKESQPATPWEADIDSLMQRQLISLDYAKRKRLYDKVQEIIAENVPLIFLASPDVLVAAKNRVGNFQPAVLSPYTLWNVEQLYLQ